MDKEKERLQNIAWKKWGPYVSDRQWATVREDYSTNGDAWEYITHDMARSKAYRWSEEGIAGICDDRQLLCFALALWNKKDPIIKERYFGLNNHEGNHGEDVKELYYYLDATPTHSYMKMLYKYPHSAYPYEQLVNENKKRTRLDAEYELMDTGIFNNDAYFDVFVEYAKATEEDILIKITVHNRGKNDAAINMLPTLWFRNKWSWGYDDYKPQMMSSNDAGGIIINHKDLPGYMLYMDKKAPMLFCDNETNTQRLYNTHNVSAYTKDGINEFIVHGNAHVINNDALGTKVALNYDITIPAESNTVIKLRLKNNHVANAFTDFDEVFDERIKEAEEFYENIQQNNTNDEVKMVQRQAFAGMLWNKQFYNYNLNKWLNGDPDQPTPPDERKKGRNHEWIHLNNGDIISMPDKWEYPWYASWDLAFHCLSFAVIDADFAKQQLSLLTHEWYMHPNGQIPAYEWNFSDVNPPVIAWAAWRVFKIDKRNRRDTGDIRFLESIFHKLLLNFTWWVNRKDAEGNNIFEGGFLGLDNIGVFDRNAILGDGRYLEQADATSWVAMYSLNLMRMALHLSFYNSVYQEMATKFFEHFLYIAQAIASMGNKGVGLWDEEDEFFYDVLKLPDDGNIKLRVHSVVGIIPLFAVEVIDHASLEALPLFKERLNWVLNNKPELAKLVSRWEDKSEQSTHLLSLLRGHRIKKILQRMLDEKEFLSEYGIRSLSKYHEQHPYEISINGNTFNVPYTPAESTSGMFGGNSNWRGPIWFPINFLIIESLQRFHYYYGDDFKVECPTGSGQYLTLNEIADELTHRLSKLFLKDAEGKRPVFGDNNLLQNNPHFNNYILFHEYFNGDTGKGLGASHQTGWTGLIAKLLQPKRKETEED